MKTKIAKHITFLTILFYTILHASKGFTHAPINLIIDHDGNVDDFVALSAVLNNPRFNLHMISVTPADSFKKEAVEITRSILDHHKLPKLEINATDDIGKNPFPYKWRYDASQLVHIPGAAPKGPTNKDPRYRDEESYLRYMDVLDSNKKFHILVTGPLSNLAKALRKKPSLSQHIEKIIFMGGAFDVQGNVDLEKTDTTQEWNVYNDPEAVKTVLQSGAPLLFVPLDATNHTPITWAYVKRLEQRATLAHHHMLIQFIKTLEKYIEHPNYQKRYFFWDTLAAGILLNPSIAHIKKAKVDVILEGAAEGRTTYSKKGHMAEVAHWADQTKTEKLLLDALTKK